MRFILTKDNYFSHVGTDPVENVICFNDKWNLNNIPTRFHYWDKESEDFILNNSLKEKIIF